MLTRIAILLLLWAAPAVAQTTCEVKCSAVAGQPVVVLTAFVPGISAYQLVMNGTPQALTQAIADGAVQFTFAAGIPAGTYAFVIRAATGTWTTDPSTLTVTAAPVPTPTPAPAPVPTPVSYRCSVPAKPGTYAGGDLKVTLRCPKGSAITKGDVLTVTK